MIINGTKFDWLIDLPKEWEIHKVKNSITDKVSSDLLAIDIKQAIYYLGELTGEISNDEILGNIFSKFCIGK